VSRDDGEIDPKNHVASVVKALRLLDAFTQERPEPTLAELIHETGYTKATTFRLLATLEFAGWLLRTPSRGYRLSLKPFELGSVVTEHLDIRREAESVMAELSEAFEETVYLMVPDHGRAVCIEHVESRQPVRLQGNVGRSRPFTLGAAPLAMLAFAEDQLLPQVVERDLDGPGDGTGYDMDSLRQVLADTRERGYSVASDDITQGISAVGAPVFDRGGAVVAAVSLAGLSQRFQHPRLDELGAGVARAARSLTARLGGTPGRR
jgi:DNA-binding IclR family transcriptional regulator